MYCLSVQPPRISKACKISTAEDGEDEQKEICQPFELVDNCNNNNNNNPSYATTPSPLYAEHDQEVAETFEALSNSVQESTHKNDEAPEEFVDPTNQHSPSPIGEQDTDSTNGANAFINRRRNSIVETDDANSTTYSD